MSVDLQIFSTETSLAFGTDATAGQKLDHESFVLASSELKELATGAHQLLVLGRSIGRNEPRRTVDCIDR